MSKSSHFSSPGFRLGKKNGKSAGSGKRNAKKTKKTKKMLFAKNWKTYKRRKRENRSVFISAALRPDYFLLPSFGHQPSPARAGGGQLVVSESPGPSEKQIGFVARRRRPDGRIKQSFSGTAVPSFHSLKEGPNLLETLTPFGRVFVNPLLEFAARIISNTCPQPFQRLGFSSLATLRSRAMFH